MMFYRHNSRLSKRSLEVLVWFDKPTEGLLTSLYQIHTLEKYLRSKHAGVCSIELLVPEHLVAVSDCLSARGFRFSSVAWVEATSERLLDCPALASSSMAAAFACARTEKVDCLLVPPQNDALAFAQEADECLNLAVTEPSFALRLIEYFVRGFDIPWSFARPMWDGVWSTFYQSSEADMVAPIWNLQSLLPPGSTLDTRESLRSLLHNRLPQICYARDKLIWFAMQKDAAQRDGFTTQKFQLEISFFLNSYYVLISGAFDHFAVLVNNLLELGLKEKHVGATYKDFRGALKEKDAVLFSLFSEEPTLKFLKRINHLRHLSAHRGSITPSVVYEEPDREPTEDEIREHLKGSDKEWMLDSLSYSGSAALREMTIQLARIEMLKEITRDVVYIDTEDLRGFINPLIDVTWNFAVLRRFLNRGADELARYVLSKSSPQGSTDCD